MTKKQIERMARRLWDKVTHGDGYQPYGYDRVTMWATHPGYFPALARLKALWQAAA